MEVGQIVYVKRWDRGVGILEFQITKIGTKYFYIKDLIEYAVDKKTLWHRDKHWPQSDFKVFLEKQDILDAEGNKNFATHYTRLLIDIGPHNTH